VKQRDTVSMPVDEVQKLLETGRKLIAGRLAGQDAEVLDDYVARGGQAIGLPGRAAPRGQLGRPSPAVRRGRYPGHSPPPWTVSAAPLT